MDKQRYKELFISEIATACGDINIAKNEYEAHIESVGYDIDYSTPEEDAKECMSYWAYSI